MSQTDRLIVIGTLVRPHGLSREGVSFFKVHFDFAGHSTLPEQHHVWIEDQKSFRKISLVGEVSPLGGKWAQATGAKIGLADSEIASLGNIQGRKIALPRETFAKLSSDEVYICDLLGVEVRDELGNKYGHVEAAAPLSKDAWNIVARASKIYEFPMKWIDWASSSFAPDARDRFVVVPNVSMWVEVESLEGERDDD